MSDIKITEANPLVQNLPRNCLRSDSHSLTSLPTSDVKGLRAGNGGSLCDDFRESVILWVPPCLPKHRGKRGSWPPALHLGSEGAAQRPWFGALVNFRRFKWPVPQNGGATLRPTWVYQDRGSVKWSMIAMLERHGEEESKQAGLEQIEVLS